MYINRVMFTFPMTKQFYQYRNTLIKWIQNFDAQTTIEWVSKTLQKKGASFYGSFITIGLCSFFISDLTALLLGEWIPDPRMLRFKMNQRNSAQKVKTIESYQVIFSRNLFNSKGMIPGDISEETHLNAPAVKTSLPLNLVGTLILKNELLSIATIEDKATSLVYALRFEDEIPNKIQIFKIEPKKVTFINKNSGKKEYIEIIDDLIMSPRMIQSSPNLGSKASSNETPIEKLSPTQFSVARTEVDKALSNLHNVLTQARAIPNFENGAPAGYKLFQIVPGSIYDKLGLMNGDTLIGLNGEAVNDPGKAFEMLNQLKTSNHLELQIKKDDGKSLNYVYDIR